MAAAWRDLSAQVSPIEDRNAFRERDGRARGDACVWHFRIFGRLWSTSAIDETLVQEFGS